MELRTTHAHKVEVNLTKDQRAEVKKRFADSKVQLMGLGSAFDYHTPDQAKLRKDIEDTKEYIVLAQDVGATGVKVRPNGLPDGVPVEKTLEQIGRALNEVAADAAGVGIEIRIEVHGRGTCLPPHMAAIMAAAPHPNAKVCWNSNYPHDLDAQGQLEPHFRLLAGRIGLVHINRLHCGYPYPELFRLLKGTGYEGCCLAELPAAGDVPCATEFLRHYRQCFELLGGA